MLCNYIKNYSLINKTKLEKYSKTTKIITCCAGVFIFYLFYGYILEFIFSIPELSKHGWYITLIQFSIYGMFATCEILFENHSLSSVSWKTYCLLAFFTVGSIGCSNTGLQYLNYPTQVIVKCCKLIPVLIGGILIQKKQYKCIDFIAAICMSLGLIIFILGDCTVSPLFHFKGILLISIALVFDGIIGNYQEKTMKQNGASNTEIICFSFIIGAVYILIGLTLSGQFFDGMHAFNKNPIKNYSCIFLLSITGYIGIQILLILVRTCGAFVAVVVTTFRKVISIILSFFLFTKPFTWKYLWGGLIVFLGVYLHIGEKNQEHFKTLIFFLKSKLFNYFNRQYPKNQELISEV